MTTSNFVDQRREGAAPRHDAATPAHNNGLPSDAELTRLVNNLYGEPYSKSQSGSRVPTTAGQPGVSGAPLQQPLGRESATTLGVAEDKQVYGLLHPQSQAMYSPTPAQGSGGSDGGYGKSLTGAAPMGTGSGVGREGFSSASGLQGSKPPQAGAPLLGSEVSHAAIGLEPGRTQTLPFPHSAGQHGGHPAPSLPTGGMPSQPAGPQSPGNSRGGFGRPLPSSPEGMLAQSVPGASRTSHLGLPPGSGSFATLAPGGGPLGSTPPQFASLDGFQSEDERVLAMLPACIARQANIAGQFPTSAGGFGRSASHPGSPGTPGVVPKSAGTAGGIPTGQGGSEAPFYFLREATGAMQAAKAPIPNTTKRPPGVAPNPPEEMWAGRRVFDIDAIRRDFPILQGEVHGHRLVWFDNAATTQKPNAVIQRLVQFYEHEDSNIHRAAHELAARSTDAYEDARETVSRFIGAGDSSEIVFVRGTTEAINLVAQSWGRQNIAAGDEILITHLEHHANIVPWQHLVQEKGAKLRVAPVDDSGQVRLDEFQRLISRRTRIVAFPQVSNALGTVTPAREMVEIAHRYGAKVLVDGAQSIAHMPTNMQKLGADWYAFSGHKIFGPTGIGVLYGKQDLLNSTLPWQGGGNMIKEVHFDHSSYQPAPGRFEAGTGNIADAVGLGAALKYLQSLGMHNVNRYEHELLEYGSESLRRINGLTLIGTAREKASVLSFVLDGHSNDEVGKVLNAHGIAVRTGHHCAQPILRRFGLDSTVRPSLALYNTKDEIDLLADVIYQIQTGRT